MMKSWIGLVVIIFGLLLAAYVGLWVMFIGGIVGVVHALKAPSLDAMELAIQIAKILLASPTGGVIVTISFLLGRAIK